MVKKLMAIVVILGLTYVGPDALAGGDKPDRDGFITKVGTYKLYHGKLTLRFFENKGKLNYEQVVTTRKFWLPFIKYEETSSAGPAEPWIEKGPNWFAFAESPKERSPQAVWIYSGRDQLVLLAWDTVLKWPDGKTEVAYTFSSYDSDSFPMVAGKIPQAVLARLPRTFKRKIGVKIQSPGPNVTQHLNQSERLGSATSPAR